MKVDNMCNIYRRLKFDVFFSPGGQCMLCKSLSMEKASTVALVRTFDIVLAFVFQSIFFDHQPDIYSVAGAILVAMCNIVILSTPRYPLQSHDDHNLHNGKSK